jgi:hypothetical protein
MSLAPGPVTLGLLLAGLVVAGEARSDPLGQCLDARVAEYEAEVPFLHTGRVECPVTELVGLIPKERRHDWSAIVSYAPPDGFAIRVDPDRGTPSVESAGGAGGSVGVPEIGEAGVSVTIACHGLPLGGGPAWQEVRIAGYLYRRADVDLRKDWLLACAREIGRSP